MIEKREKVISRMKMSKSTGSSRESTKGKESPMRGRDESQMAAEGEVRRYRILFIETWERAKDCAINSQRGKVFRMRNLYVDLWVLKGKANK